ncbi:MAG: HDIG domain-containing protein [Abditibacteriales bacterium]|nr:HDIG domain-containing protein [Abditibacteriales bacterium]MDW8364937.1 HDIG domain-containing protein [Abditibacteriales bacterium]
MHREDALALLHEHTKSDSLRKHAYAVEAAMRFYARKFGEDEEKWGVVGLLHDFDYEANPSPESHPWKGVEILRAKGYPEDVLHAILGHATYTNTPRLSLLDKTLFAVDELTGFIIAVALVRPNKSIHEVEVASVKRKMKDKAFARAVKREDIVQGAEELGVPLDEHIANVIAALKGVAGTLGLE